MPAHILIVDDDDAARALLEAALLEMGFEVTAAANGERLIVLSRQLRPALIISDIEMPGVSGDTAQTLLRGSALLREIPAIFVSGLPPAEAKKRLELGPKDRFLPKPVDLAVLKATIRELLPAQGEAR